MIAILAYVSLALAPGPACNRRSAVTSAAAAAAASAFAPAARALEAMQAASQYGQGVTNQEGDAAICARSTNALTFPRALAWTISHRRVVVADAPKAKIETAGAKSARIAVSMPSPGPLSNKDYVDVMWLRDSRGTVLAAGEFRANGKGIKEQASGVAEAPVEPKFVARADSGTGDVFPVVHTKKGYVWEGAPVFVK